MKDKNVKNYWLTHLKSCDEKILTISSKNQWFIILPRGRFVTHLAQNFQTSSKDKYTKRIPIFYII